MRSPWFFAITAIAGIWIAVSGVIWWARSAKTTPESLVTFVATHPVDGRGPAQREKVIQSVATQLNQLEYEKRREVRLSHRLDAFFRSLTPEEQDRFLDLTGPAGFKQMMEAFNKMPAAKRKALVEKSLEQMKDPASPEGKPQTEDPHVRKLIEQGLQSFYSDASSETKLDLAPLIEQIQKNLQQFGS